MLKSHLGCYKWYLSISLPVRYGSGTKQAEASGHVTPEVDECGDWSLVHKA